MSCWRSSVVAQRVATTPTRLAPAIPTQITETVPRSITIAAGMRKAATSHSPTATAAPTRNCGPFVAAISIWNSRSRGGSRNRSVSGSRAEPGWPSIGRSLRFDDRLRISLGRVTRTSSSSTSTRLFAPPSTASNRRRTVWPAKASSEIEAVRHTPSTSAGVPATRQDLRPGSRRRFRRSPGACRTMPDAALWAKTYANVSRWPSVDGSVDRRRADGRPAVEVVGVR